MSLQPKGEMNTSKKSVLGFSRLDYILYVCNWLADKPLFSFEDLYGIVKFAALEIESSRSYYARGRGRIDVVSRGFRKDIRTLDEMKKLQPYGPQKLIYVARNGCLRALLKWQLVAKVDKDSYRPLEAFKEIGRLLRGGKEKEAKRRLYHYLLRSRREPLFDPGTFLLGLRNYPNTLQDERTITYDKSMVDFFGTNPVSMDVLLDWASFFGFVDHFDFGKRKVVYLTDSVATLKELVRLMVFRKEQPNLTPIDCVNKLAAEMGLHRSASMSVLECAQRLGLFESEFEQHSSEEIEEKICESAKVRHGLVMSDLPETAGVVDRFNPQVHHADRCYVILDRPVDTQDFHKVAYREYKRLATGLGDYVWIHELRKAVSVAMLIRRKDFDEILLRLYQTLGPRSIQLLKMHSSVLASWKAVREEPLVFSGNVFHKIKIAG